jgi:hypothetical protein
MIEMGLVVALGLFVTYVKLSWRSRIWMNSHPVFMDVVVFAALTMLHWGTFSGVMVATVGALFCSITIGVARWLFGHTNGKQYVPGRFDVRSKL